ncbi:hypothetical protein [Aliarcobacter skirrowii]|uniref:Uncharacterized protein n=1 Tax=Aliarcobacter skirrowii TaxID=28200 RepID=A0A2U2C163_9BACT|nr:hypothetical protein [Aliarcobacter skirrowii]PWE19064.1 hypothetical protein DGF29_09855 [Aliarcobacter skirrowii]PWE21716.1 hypothetical protein DF188_05750 [Aliarcobacter skirrowii]PWE24818.1 hypothetical protein DGE88_08785 [Aliarcobacter skirrowii]RJO55010.1 hypothetical protein DIR39_09795 [Aliarcobacter skirrowii]RJO57055.1 hypothetical protein DIR38_09435 [Aliarcobacter skirrowii]
MTSKQIVVTYLSKKIKNAETIFNDVEIFKSILFWSRDAAREYFSTQPNKFFLLEYIDDVAPVVDEYMLVRVEKMYKKAFKTQNRLFENLCSYERIISWLIDRWINVFINLTTNKNYRDYIDISKIKMNFHDDIYENSKNIDDDIEFEKAKKLSKNEKIKLLQEVWQGAIYDDFDEEDMKYLCNKLDLKIDEVFENKGDLCKLNLKKIQIEDGNYQLELII